MGFIRDNFLGGAEKKAAQTQANAQTEAIAEAKAAGETARGDLQPFTTAGSRVLNPLVDFALEGGNPGFERTEGFDDIQQSAAARGKLSSGETLRDLTEFNAGVNERFRSNRFDELLRIATLGQNSAVDQANAALRTGDNVSSGTVNRGDALAAGIIGKKNAIGSTLTDIAGAVGGANGGFLDKVKERID